MACIKCDSDSLVTNEVAFGDGRIWFLNHSRMIDDLIVELQDTRFATSVEQMVENDVDPDKEALEAVSWFE